MKIKVDVKQVSKLEILPIILVLILIVCGAIGIISYHNSSQILKDSIIDSAILRTKDNACLISSHIEEFKRIIQGVAERSEIQSMQWDTQKTVLSDEAKRLNIIRFQVTDLKGYSYSTAGGPVDFSGREWFKEAVKGNITITEPFAEKGDNKMIVVCSAPIKDKSGKIAGTLGASIEPHILYDIIKNISVGETGYAFIVSRGGKMIAHPEDNFIISAENGGPDLKQLYNDVTSGKTGFSTYNYNNVLKIAAYAAIPDSDWILVLSAPEKEVFNGMDILKNKFLFLTLIMILICILSCLLIMGYLLRRKTILNLKKLVEEDEKLLKESAELENIRSQFFANISHEFRTPLNVILSSLQLCKFYLEKGQALQSENMLKYMKTMRQNCYRLMRLVNNLIDTTRIDVGFLEKHVKDQNIVKIVEDIAMSIEEFTNIKGLKLHFEKNTQEKIIACDVDKIERIMLNLISNAIKFTDPGGGIFVKVLDKGESVIISVKDTGIGIPADKQKIIFERFVQVEQSLSRNHEGSGIGLSMARSFVEMHGGTLSVISEYGKGSEFIIKLPAVVSEYTENMPQTDEADSQRRIERINIEFSDIYC